MDIFKFNKSLETRVHEAESILCISNNKISAADVCKEWSYFLEIEVESKGIFFFTLAILFFLIFFIRMAMFVACASRRL